MKNIPDIFGQMVFNDAIMQHMLPKDIYNALQKTMQQGIELPLSVANVVANAMKEWAIGLGARHFTHWFQPMTGLAAEKHDSFISPAADGKVIIEFSGKELVRGEFDASSLPSGGLRATFEARGYTIWDTTSYAFIKDGTLCIPTAFCSYGGHALDKKTPLLRSMEALNKQAMRILQLFGTKASRVVPTVGSEQEFFLIDRNIYLKRPDLVYTGRTLFGAKPPKGQELSDHYCVSLVPRVSAFMHELTEQLWKLGVYVATKHNEVAPLQHEVALFYSSANIASDHNQLAMEVIKSVAGRHNLVCLFHEKPFMGVNGSGKHSNWSLATDSGVNLLEPSKAPHENMQFLLFLVAVIAAVNKYQELLRVSAASAGNDHRLGANEAPPAILSIFIGDELYDILTAIETDANYFEKTPDNMEIGVTALPHFLKDATDRNRTSPMAFTGNKFEFRMLGSQSSLANPNIVLNTAMADILEGYADELEGAVNFKQALTELIKKNVKKHKRIIFNGNNYSDEWVLQAKARGLMHFKNTVETLPSFIDKKSQELFGKHNVFSYSELNARYEILLENYCKTLQIEAATMVELAKKQILPACLEYQKQLADLVAIKNNIVLSKSELIETVEHSLLEQIAAYCNDLFKSIINLQAHIKTNNIESFGLQTAKYYTKKVVPAMQQLRGIADNLEDIMPKKYWPLPSYAQLFYSVDM